ncbi:hypothetical protein BaRGS_00034639, partial [Batillaria attramentaria]
TPFKLTHVIKHVTNEGKLVTVQYEGTTKPSVYLWADDHVLGTVQVTIASQDRQPTLYFHLPNAYWILDLALYTFPEYLEEDVPTVSLDVSEEALVYSAGQDAGVMVTFRHEVAPTVPSSLRWETIVTSPAYMLYANSSLRFSRRSRLDRGLDNPVRIVASRERAFEETFWLRVDTKDTSREGVLKLHSKTHLYVPRHSGNTSLFSLSVGKLLPFYRADHEGPYEPGFVSFIKDRDYWSEFARVTCKVGAYFSCGLKCTAFGDGLNEVDVFRVLPDGQMRLLSKTHLNRDGITIEGLHYFRRVARSDAGQYMCVARTNTSSVSVTGTLT